MTEQTSQTESTETTAGETGAESTALGTAEQQQVEEKSGTETEQKTEAETGEQNEAPAGAPEKYDLKAPEGTAFDTETFAAVEPVLRELNLPNEAAQKLVDAYAAKVVPALTKRANDALLQTAADQRKAWAEAFENDPDIGGAKKGDTLSAAARVFDHYGLKKGEGLRLLLDESGLGNHPELIRTFARIGHDMAEGGFERGTETKHPKSAEQTLYAPEFQGKK